MSATATRHNSKSVLLNKARQAIALEEIDLWEEGTFDQEVVTSQELAERAKVRRLRRWMWNRTDAMASAGLMERRFDPEGRGEYEVFFPHSLMRIGVDTPAKGNRFIDLYLQVHVADRGWLSGYQVDQRRVAEISLSPSSYKKLPLWVKQGLITAPDHAKIGGDRVGNIWRLPHCVKAWRWCDRLPKNLAEKIGKLSPKMRMLAGWAYASARYEGIVMYGLDLPRSVRDAEFWENLAALERMTLANQLKWMLGTRGADPGWDRVKWTTFLSHSLGLPWGTFMLPKYFTPEQIWEVMRTYGSPEQVGQLESNPVGGRDRP
jgi:hypothetical protein